MEQRELETNKKQDGGFTLVELLIVIVILGILATVVVFAVRGITDEGESNACAVGERTIQTAVEAYWAQTDPHAYPASEAALVTAGLVREDTGTWSIDSSTGVVSATAGGDCDGVSF
jgi:prepilin-type N-terminal cleavage/methylation domain-containing protein